MPKIRRLSKNHLVIHGLLIVLIGGLLAYKVFTDSRTTIAPLPATAVTYAADSTGRVELKDLGIAVTIGSELAKQGLLGVPSTDAAQSSKTIAFTTAELAAVNKACDGVEGAIGTMIRYAGASTAMTEHRHVHGSTIFDYPGFHIMYQTVQDSCVASTPGYPASELGKETVAARELWDAMRSAKPL